MKDQKGKTWIAGALLALTASLCCLTPVVALLSGVSGIAATFSFLEPIRPYLISITVLVLGLAWYQKLKPKKEKIDCACEDEERPRFWQSKTFLSIVTALSIALLAFPGYSHIFYSVKESALSVPNASSSVVVNFSISGMTCTACEEHVTHAVNGLDGVLESSADHHTGTASVKFDPSKGSVDKIVDAIDDTGYKVRKYEIKDPATPVSRQAESADWIELKVSGMTCSGCEKHVEHAVNQLDGIVQVSASYEEEKATVTYDASKVALKEIKEAIHRSGYKIIEEK